MGAAGAGLAVLYLMNLNRLSSELETVTSVSISKLTLTGLELKVDVILKNPSGGSLKVKYPFVKMQYGTSTFATSEAKNEDFVLPQYSEVKLPAIYVNIGLLTLASSVPDALAELRKNGKVDITVKTITTLNNTIPYTLTDTITLKNPIKTEA